MTSEKPVPCSISVRPDALQGKSLIVTGDIEGQTRKTADQILVNAGAKIEKTFNKRVELVVLGENAGDAKLKKVQKMGIPTQKWDDLIAGIKTEDSDGTDSKNMEAGEDDDDDEDDDDEDDDEVEGEDGEDDEDEEDDEDGETKQAPETTPASKSKSSNKTNAKSNTKTKSFARLSEAKTPNSWCLTGRTAIITGTIPGHDRKSAQAVIEKSGAYVAKTLNKQVEIAILGTNPGPDKLKTIEDSGIETIKWEELAGKLGIDIPAEKEVPEVDVEDAPDSITGMTVIVTGVVEGQTRSSARKLLEKAGAEYAKSLNKSVELVILGTQPGPDNMGEIADRGIRTCTWDALVKKLDLEDDRKPPRKKQKKT